MRNIAFLGFIAIALLNGCTSPQNFVQQCRNEIPYVPAPPLDDGKPPPIGSGGEAEWQNAVQACAQNYSTQHNNRVAAGVALGVLAVGAGATAAAYESRYSRPVVFQQNTVILRRYR